MGGDDEAPALLKQRVFAAVEAELVESGIDRFTIEGVARRADVAAELILARWRDRRLLLMDAMLARTHASAWNPDTGSLHTDLAAVSELGAALSQTASGRALFRRVLPSHADVDLGEISSDLWTARFSDAAQFLQRAADRGQLRDGVVAVEAVRMFAAAFYYDVIFADAPVRPEYAEQVVDIFLHGILGAGGRDRPWPDLGDLLARGRDGAGGAPAADQALEVARRALVLTREWVDALADPIVLLEAARDERGRIADLVCRDANRAACAQIGRPRAQLLGRGLAETLPDFGSAELLERHRDQLDSGRPLALDGIACRHLDEQRRLDIRLTAAGPGLFAATWRGAAERPGPARGHRELVGLCAVPSALTTPEGRFVAANPAMADFVGHDVDALPGMCWADLTAPQSGRDDAGVLADLLAGRRGWLRTVKRFVRPDGSRAWGDVTLSCLRRPGGGVDSLLAQVVDVTGYLGSRPEPDERGSRR